MQTLVESLNGWFSDLIFSTLKDYLAFVITYKMFMEENGIQRVALEILFNTYKILYVEEKKQNMIWFWSFAKRVACIFWYGSCEGLSMKDASRNFFVSQSYTNFPCMESSMKKKKKNTSTLSPYHRYVKHKCVVYKDRI